MSDMLDKLKENGVNVKFIMLVPSIWLSAVMIVFVLVAILVSQSWIGFFTYISILVAWMIGVFFGFKILLTRIKIIDKDKTDE